MSQPLHMDLFTGIGGFSLGARWSGYDTICHAEIEPYCQELLATRFPTVPNVGDVRKLCRRTADAIDGFDTSLVLREAHGRVPGAEDEDDLDGGDAVWCPLCSDEAGYPVDFGECDCIGADQFTDDYGWPDVLTAGSPCQDFSGAGKGAGIEGERSGLIMEIPRIASELYPPFVLAENVPGIKTRGFDRFAAALEGVGYTLATAVVSAAAFGYSHLRERVFIVAHHPGIRVERLWTEGIQEPQPLDRASLSVRHRDGQWKAEPDLRRVPDGIPGGMDRSGKAVNPRLKALGNAVCPDIAACFLDLIRWYATRHRDQFTLTNAHHALA